MRATESSHGVGRETRLEPATFTITRYARSRTQRAEASRIQLSCGRAVVC